MALQSFKENGPSVIFTLIGCWFVLSTSFTYVTGCQDPFDPSDEQKQNLLTGDHESIYSLPIYNINMMTLDTFKIKFPGYVNITSNWAYGIKACDKDIPLPPLQANSTCPWYYMENTDPNRFPEVIWEAKCSCGACLEFIGNAQTSNQCIAVTYNIRVLRRYSCENGEDKYLSVLEPIQTGCMCTKYIPMDSNPDSPPKPVPRL